MDRYLGGEEIKEDVLVADLEKAVARATFFPVMPVCVGHGRRLHRAAGPDRPRFPVASGAHPARGVHAGRGARRHRAV